MFWLDPSYEPKVIGWVEGMTQEERSRLVQLFQIAGFTEITPQLLVRELTRPHLEALLGSPSSGRTD